MPGKGLNDKYVPHQIRPSRQGTESVRLPRAVQKQGKFNDAPKNPYGGKRVQKES